PVPGPRQLRTPRSFLRPEFSALFRGEGLREVDLRARMLRPNVSLQVLELDGDAAYGTLRRHRTATMRRPRLKAPGTVRGSAGKTWGRRDLNPDRRDSPTRGATHACLANHGSALQSVIPGQHTRSQPSPA